MTYCVGMLMEAGLVFLSDTRTNAGVDQINTFRKMSVFEQPGERVMVLLSAGNLAITQAVVSLLFERQGKDGDSLLNVPNLFEAARHVGDCLREVHHRDAEALAGFNIDFNAAKLALPRCLISSGGSCFLFGHSKSSSGNSAKNRLGSHSAISP